VSSDVLILAILIKVAEDNCFSTCSFDFDVPTPGEPSVEVHSKISNFICFREYVVVQSDRRVVLPVKCECYLLTFLFVYLDSPIR